MTKLKIGQMVLMDTVLGAERPARIESVSPDRKARLLMLDTGERLEGVALGNISIPGEDGNIAGRERNQHGWLYTERGITNRRGGFVVRPAPNPDYVGTKEAGGA